MYVYVMDENILHVRFSKSPDRVAAIAKQWLDMGHSPQVTNVNEENHEQAH